MSDRDWRMVVDRPEAPDSDWGRLHVIPRQEARRADAVLMLLLARLRTAEDTDG